MADEQGSGRIHIDSDWKTEAAREKQRLAEQEKLDQAQSTKTAAPEASFVELVNMLAMQAAIALGGYQGPGGERIAPNQMAARHQIDLLEVLSKKTEGNLSDDEQHMLDAVLHELRMHYVTLASGKTPGAPAEG